MWVHRLARWGKDRMMKNASKARGENKEDRRRNALKLLQDRMNFKHKLFLVKMINYPHHPCIIFSLGILKQLIFDAQVYLVVSLRWSLSCFWCSGWWTVHFLWGSEECFQPVDVSIHLLVDVHARLPCTTYRHCACPETDFLGRSCRKGRGYGWGAWRSVFRARVRQH